MPVRPVWGGQAVFLFPIMIFIIPANSGSRIQIAGMIGKYGPRRPRRVGITSFGLGFCIVVYISIDLLKQADRSSAYGTPMVRLHYYGIGFYKFSFPEFIIIIREGGFCREINSACWGSCAPPGRSGIREVRGTFACRSDRTAFRKRRIAGLGIDP